MRRDVVGLMLTMLAVGCTAGGDLQPLPEQPPEVYRLGPGDVIRVITFGDQELTAEFRVSDSGNIAVPLLGTVQAAGLSTGELEAKLLQALIDKKIFRDPSVSVEVTRYRPVFMLGEVAKPGEFPYQPGMTVLSAVAVAGGFTYRAVHDFAGVLRQAPKGPIQGRVTPQALLKPGDVVTIYERSF